MKIDPTARINPPGVVNDERTKAGKQNESADAKGRSDVQLSALSSQMKNIEASLGVEEPIDSRRVAEVKAAIAEGRFEVNAEKVAERLVAATREFLGAQKQ